MNMKKNIISKYLEMIVIKNLLKNGGMLITKLLNMTKKENLNYGD